MKEVPRGWAEASIGELGDYLNGRGFKKSEWRESGRPIIRIQNLTGSGTRFNYFDGEPEERYMARDGDLLMSWAATLGVFVWRGAEAVVNQHIFKVVSKIDPRFHRYLLQEALVRLRTLTHGSGIVHVTKPLFEQTAVLLPPLNEQRRIVAAIEESLSRLDAADTSLGISLRRARALYRMTLAAITCEPWRDDWDHRVVGEVGTVQLGRLRAPKHHVGPNMRPYLRVANVFEDRIDTSNVMEMDFSDEEFERYRLAYGDILLNEGQSPELVGRPAMFRDELPGACFTNSLIRFRPHDGIDGRFALLVFRSHLHSGRFMREARITTNIAHLSASRFQKVEFPVPPLDQQRRIVADIEQRLSAIDAMAAAIAAAQKRSVALHRAILDRAFRGELVAQDPADEPASVLLERIRAERASTPVRRSGRRRPGATQPAR